MKIICFTLGKRRKRKGLRTSSRAVRAVISKQQLRGDSEHLQYSLCYIIPELRARVSRLSQRHRQPVVELLAACCA